MTAAARPRPVGVAPVGVVPAEACERFFAANLLAHPELTIAVAGKIGLAVEDFGSWVGAAYAGALALVERGVPVDVPGIAAELAARRVPLPAGAVGWFVALTEVGVADADPERWSREIAKHALRRRLPPLAQAVAQARPGVADDLAAAVDRLRRLDAGPAHGVRVLSFGELAALDLPPRAELLAPVLRVQDLVMVHGWRGAGKSLFAATLALGVAAGRPVIRGWTSPAPAGVLLVDGELPARTLQSRLAALALGCDAVPVAPFKIIAADLQEHGLPSLATVAGQALVEDHLDGVALLLLDNLSTLFGGLGPENEAESWGPVQEWLLTLRRRGVAVVLLHHSGKAGAQRGTSKREDVLDSVLSLRRPADYNPIEGARFELHFEKSRGLAGAALEPFEARLEGGPAGGWYWTTRTLEDKRDSEILALKKSGLTVRAVARELGVNASTVSRRLRSLAGGSP